MSAEPDKNFRLEQACASDDSIQQVHAQLQRTKPEKAHGYSLLPLAILGLICTAVFFGSIYLAHNSIRFDPLVYNDHASREQPGAVKLAVASPRDLGKLVFANTCITCHQANGLGVPGAFPPLAGSEWAQGTEERAVRIVLLGLNGPVTVKGQEFNSAMPPLGSVLKDDQIAHALTYVRSEWGNKAPEVTPETVARIRAELAGRAAPWTAAELLKIGN